MFFFLRRFYNIHQKKTTLIIHKTNPIIKHKVGLLNLAESAYGGGVDDPHYQLYLAIKHIDHMKTKAISPQTSDICERFHKTIFNR